MNQPTTLKWHPIEDLPTGYEAMASTELRALSEVWLEQRESLQDSTALRRFNEQLQRQWAIETGVLERLYSLDRGITTLLIERGIDSNLIPDEATDRDPSLVAAMIQDQEAAIDWVFEVIRGERPLSTSFIKELHALMTRHQTTTMGQMKSKFRSFTVSGSCFPIIQLVPMDSSMNIVPLNRQLSRWIA